jgi:hypothetical protein
MNPIAIWSKFKDYGDWCYQHRIPEASEFVKGFEFEYISFLGVYPKEGITKPYLSIDYNIISHTWEKRIVTDRLMDYEVLWSILPVNYGIVKKLPINHLSAYLEAGYIRVLKNNIIVEVKVENDNWIQDGNYEQHYWRYLWEKRCKHKVELIGFYNSSNKLCIHQKRILSNNCKEISNMAAEENKEYHPITKSKYKLGLKSIKPNVNLLSDIIIKLKKIGKKIDVSHIIDTITKYPSRCLGINKGYEPLHDLEDIKNNLYNHQPEKNPQFTNYKGKNQERLVYIATKDKKQYAKVHWYEANEKITTQLADEPEWKYISKQEGKKYFNTIAPGLSFIPASEPWIEKVKDYETGVEKEEYVGTFKNVYKPTEFPKSKNKSSTKRVDKSNYIKPKRNHPGRNNYLKSVLWDVLLTKHDTSSVGPVDGCSFKVEAINEQSAINKAWNKFVPLYDVKLTSIKPYYNAVAKRLEESNTSVSTQEDRSTKSFLEPIKHVLINTLKNGEKKITEVTSYKRVYPVKEPYPFKKKWKCPMTNPSKKFSTMKIEQERKKLNEELKLKKQNRIIERKTSNKKILV